MYTGGFLIGGESILYHSLQSNCYWAVSIYLACVECLCGIRTLDARIICVPLHINDLFGKNEMECTKLVNNTLLFKRKRGSSQGKLLMIQLPLCFLEER